MAADLAEENQKVCCCFIQALDDELIPMPLHVVLKGHQGSCIRIVLSQVTDLQQQLESNEITADQTITEVHLVCMACTDEP